MLVDARGIARGKTINCDICIVGAGAAGITLAYELCNQGMGVLLLESGGIKYEKQLQYLNCGEVDLRVHNPLEECRRRQIGGVTTVWGGRCVPFDRSDFEARSHVPYSGWPITKNDLNPYYKRAHEYCEIGNYIYAVKDVLSEPGCHKPMIPGFESTDISIENLYLFSPPTDFGKKYLDPLKQSTNVTVYIYATCLKILTNLEGTKVDCVQVSSVQQNDFFVYPKQLVLATGGLEVTRLLLLSNDVHPNGLGNQHNLLGRFYMGHINHHFDVEFTDPESIVWDYETTPQGVYCQRQIAIAEDKRQQYGLLNQRVFIERPEVSDPSHGSSIFSATYLAKGLQSKQTKYKYPLQHAKNILFDFKGIVNFSYKWITKRVLSQRQLPSVVAQSPSGIYTFRVDSEQIPNPNSRVRLSRNKDIFGLNQLKVDWRCTELDIKSIEKSVDLIIEAFAKSGVGKLRSLPDISPAPQDGHHLGTTRMASTPQQGVVDLNCQVYGVSNLYIASSSVFATASYANPTLTVVALAIRLADYLKMKY